MWSVIGDSATGTSHHSSNVPCQDSFRFQVAGPEREWLVIVVADGAGSASHSEVGAQVVCDDSIDGCLRLLASEVNFGGMTPSTARETVVSIIRSAREAILNKSVELCVMPRQLACTYLLAILGPSMTATAQIGDGAIVFNDDAGLRAAIWPEVFEYANVTSFITDDAFEESIQFVCSKDPADSVAVLTDGLQRIALDFTARQPHEPFFRPLFAALRSTTNVEALSEPLRLFLDSPQVNDRTDDDKTIVVAVRMP